MIFKESHEHINQAIRWFNGLINKDVQITNEVYSIQSVDFDRQVSTVLLASSSSSFECRLVLGI